MRSPSGQRKSSCVAHCGACVLLPDDSKHYGFQRHVVVDQFAITFCRTPIACSHEDVIIFVFTKSRIGADFDEVRVPTTLRGGQQFRRAEGSSPLLLPFVVQVSIFTQKNHLVDASVLLCFWCIAKINKQSIQV